MPQLCTTLAAPVLSLVSACVFVTRDARTEVVVAQGQGEDEEVVVSSVGEHVLTLGALDRTIEVVTARARTCTRIAYETYEVRVTKKLGIAWAEWYFDAINGIAQTYFLAPFALIGLAGAGAVALASLPIAVGDLLVSNHWSVRERGRRAARTASFPCPLPLAAHVRIDTPSGVTLTVDTGATGRGTIELPATEPASGVIRATVGRQRTHLTYFQDRASCVATRAGQLAGITAAPRDQRQALVTELPACGKLTSGGPADAPREEAWELTRRAITDALAGRCRAVLAASGEIADLDRAHHDAVFSTEPDIAVCLATGLVRDQIAAGVATVGERVRRCAPLLPGGGTIRIQLDVGAGGRVRSTSVRGGGSELAECVQLALSRAIFPATQTGGQATIPFELPAWTP